MLEKLDAFINDAKVDDPGFRVYPDVIEMVDHSQKELKRKEKTGKLFSRDSESFVFEGLIHANLYKYQKEGVQKIVKTGRILLADEICRFN